MERSKRARDELAYLLQNRRKILVDMTFRLAIDKKMVPIYVSTYVSFCVLFTDERIERSLMGFRLSHAPQIGLRFLCER